VWIDSHPDIGTPASQYPGFHAMAVAALTGHGHPDGRLRWLRAAYQ
jgi:arginase